MRRNPISRKRNPENGILWDVYDTQCRIPKADGTYLAQKPESRKRESESRKLMRRNETHSPEWMRRKVAPVGYTLFYVVNRKSSLTQIWCFQLSDQ